MALTHTVRGARSGGDSVTAVRIAIVVGLLAVWEAVSASGLLFQNVVPSVLVVGRAVVRLLAEGAFWHHLAITAGEIGAALAIGGGAGLVAGLALGRSRLLAAAYEPFVYYLGPTPKIVFFPVMLMLFGVGAGSKVAMGALSCFFPVAVSAAAGVRQIDGVLIRVGQSFRASRWQMVAKIYLPAMRLPVVNGVRLGLGVAIIGTLLAETKLSNQGLGYLVIQTYTTFDMPRMYALLILLFVVSIGANAALGRLGHPRRSGE